MEKNIKIRQLLDRINYTLAQTVPGFNGLLGGNSGLALYYFYLNKSLPEENFAERSGEIIDHIFETVNSDEPRLTGPAFAVGAAGFGYLMNHLVQEDMIDFDVDEGLGHLDTYLFDSAVELTATGQADFLHQALGILHYFSSKPNIQPFIPQIDKIINQLDQVAIQDELGWRLVSTFGPRAGIHYDFSTAHGLSGTLRVLMQVYEAGHRSELIARVVREGIKFMTYFQINPVEEELKLSAFPLSVQIEHLQADYSNMLAWCYGDFCPVFTIAKAGRLFEEKNWLDNARELSLMLSKRLEVENNLVQNDSHFCHGASGVAQCFKSLHREIHLPELQTAYSRWIDITIQTLDEDLSNGLYVGKEIGFLEGMAGVGLTLLSALSEEDLRWDKALLL